MAQRCVMDYRSIFLRPEKKRTVTFLVQEYFLFIPVYYHRLQFRRYCTFTEIKVYQCWDEKSIWWFSFYQFHPFYSYVNIFPTYKWCCGVWRSLSLLWQSWSSKLNLTNMRIVSFDISFLLIKIGKYIVIIKITLILQ